jgi:hypothetical protein
MIGNRAATIYGLQAGTRATEGFFPAVPMPWLSGAAQGIDWRVFKEQQHISLPFRNLFFL